MGERTTERAGAAERPQESGVAAPGRGGRMSRHRKTAAVLRLAARRRSGDGVAIARVTAATLSKWREAFLAAGEAASRPGPATARRWRAVPEGAARRNAARARAAGAELTTLEAGGPLVRRRWKR